MTESFGKRIQINIVLKVFGCILLAVVAGYRLSQLTTIHVLFDEFGYSATAAYYNGYDWSSVASHSAYYSYGLSLILSGIMHMTQGNMALYYQLGIMSNIGLLVGSFLMGCSVGRQLFEDIPEYVVIIASFCISFYTNTLIQTNILWTETLLYFLFWVSTWFILRMIKTSKLRSVIGLAVSGGYMYMVHQRALAILIAICMVVVGHFIIRKNKKLLFLFVFIMLGMMVAACLFKGDLKINLWNIGSGNKEVNDYNGQISKVTDIVSSWGGMKAFILSLAGKIYYILTAGCMIVAMFFSGVIQCVREKEYKTILVYIYMILCLLGAIGISSIFMLRGNRQDTLIYGRYTEYVIGPVLLTGILFFWKRKISKKTFWIMNMGTVLTAVLVYIKFKNTGFTVYNIVCALGLSSIFKNGQEAKFAPMVAVIIAIAVGMLMYYSAMHLDGFRIRIAGILILPMIFWSYTNVMAMETITGANVNSAGYEDVAQHIRLYTENGKMPVYFLTDVGDFQSRYVETVQFLVPDISIQYVQKEDIERIEDIEEGIILIDQKCFDVFDLLPQYQVLEYSKGMFILAHTESKKVLELKANDFEFLSIDECLIMTDRQMYTNAAKCVDTTIWESTGEPGYLLYGPYIFLGAGEYIVDMEIDILEGNKSGQVKFDAYAGNILTEKEIRLDSNIEKISINFTLQEETDQIEFRLYGSEGCYVQIKNIYVKKMS